MRPVCRIEWDVSEEWLLRLTLSIHPAEGLAKKQVRAIAFGLLELPVVPESWINVGIVRRVAAGAGIRLPDPAAAVDIHFIEAAAFWPVGFLIAEVPLPKDARGI